MNGATAEPWVNTIKLPNRTKTTIIGKSQNFFRSFMKAQSSMTNPPMRHLLVEIVLRIETSYGIAASMRAALDRFGFQRKNPVASCPFP